jgi:hypothetical protein
MYSLNAELRVQIHIQLFYDHKGRTTSVKRVHCKHLYYQTYFQGNRSSFGKASFTI